MKLEMLVFGVLCACAVYLLTFGDDKGGGEGKLTAVGYDATEDVFMESGVFERMKDDCEEADEPIHLQLRRDTFDTILRLMKGIPMG